jgi:hypothetical protein
MKMISSLKLAAVSMVLLATIVKGAQAPVDLGTSGNYVILSKTGISTTGVTSIVGDIGVSPIDSTGITGFSLTVDALGEFATSAMVTGNVYASDYAVPTPTSLTTAVSDMQTAFTDAAGRSLPDATELGAGDISGMTIAPGLYKWGSGLLITSGVTLSGGANDVWILQIAGDLTVGNDTIVHLSGGAKAANIFWQVAGETIIGTGSHFEGILLCQTAIHLQTGASMNGRLLAQTAVTLQASDITSPSTRILKFSSIARASNGTVTLTIMNTLENEITLQHSTDLTNWTTFSTTTPVISPFQITHSTAPSDAKRFYRAFYP